MCVLLLLIPSELLNHLRSQGLCSIPPPSYPIFFLLFRRLTYLFSKCIYCIWQWCNLHVFLILNVQQLSFKSQRLISDKVLYRLTYIVIIIIHLLDTIHLVFYSYPPMTMLSPTDPQLRCCQQLLTDNCRPQLLLMTLLSLTAVTDDFVHRFYR